MFWRAPLSADGIRQAAQAWEFPPWAAELLLRRQAQPSDLDPGRPLDAPELLLDMDKALRIIRQHLDAGQRVRVYGDYDADGVTATAVLVRGLALMGFGGQVDFYIPNRFDEGYGLHEEAVIDAVRDGVSLMVTVDCGSSSPDAAETARRLGLSLVITDHHALPDLLPPAAALVNPERQPETDKLSGAGVALQLVRGLLGADAPDLLYGIAAIGTVADVVPLIGSNRTLVSRGLAAIRQRQVPAATALFGRAGRSIERTQAQDLAFVAGPRLNAAGRMGAADAAVHLLLEDRVSTLEALADTLSELNRERRLTEQRIIDDAWKRIPRDASGRLYPFTVIAGEGWHEGVIGIVAARFRHWLRRPVAVISWDGESGRGSARGVDGLNLIAHLRNSAELFAKLGGHPGAAGFSLIRRGAGELSRVLSHGLPGDVIRQQYLADPYDLAFEDAWPVEGLWRQLERFEPFGRGFESPRFLVRGHVHEARLVGSEGEHVSFILKGHRARAIGFGLGRRASGLEPGDPVRFVAELEPNWYRGSLSYQWRVLEFDGPFPRRTLPVRQGEPAVSPPIRVIWIVDSDRAVRLEASRRGAAAYVTSKPLGELAAMEEQARRGVVQKIVVSQWRPWPRLWDWADAVVWLCRPRSRRKLEEAAALLDESGELWQSALATPPRVRTKAQRLALTREKLGRHWRAWEFGQVGLMAGRAVFDELELSPARAKMGERRSLQASYVYQMALWESERDYESSGTFGEEEMHGLD